MALTSLPTRGAGDLGAALTDARAPEANELSAVNLEQIKERIIELGTDVGIDSSPAAGSIKARLSDLENARGARAAGRDNFTEHPGAAWAIETSGATAAALWSANVGAAATGFPDAGVLALKVSDPGEIAKARRAKTGLAVSDTGVLVLEWFGKIDDPTNCTWFVGITDADGLDGEYVGLVVVDGVAALAHGNAGPPTASTAVTLPTLASGQAYRIKIEVDRNAGEARIYGAASEDAYALLGTLAYTVVSAVYHPFLFLEGSDTDDHLLLSGWIGWDADASSDLLGSFVDDLQEIESLVDAATRAYVDTPVVRSISVDDALELTDQILNVDTSGGDVDLTLTAPATPRSFLIKKVTTDANVINLVQNASENIEGAAATFLLPGSDATDRPAWTVYTDGTDWWIA